MTESTTLRPIRRGLPRVSGGEAWPPERLVEAAAASAALQPAAVAAPAGPRRRGLPRIAGGDPWPDRIVTAVAAPTHPEPITTLSAGIEADAADATAAVAAAPTATSGAATATAAPEGEFRLEPIEGRRRGLPRIVGGEPWPPVRHRRVAIEPAQAAVRTTTAAPAPTALASAKTAAKPAAAAAASASAKPAKAATSPWYKTRWGRIGGPIAALLALLAVGIFAARWFVDTEMGQDFLERFPGETHLPEWAPVGIPAWVGWQHFFNMFLMVLIIRSGLTVRHEKKPPANVTLKWPRNASKISLSLWFHLALDALWLVNGVVFIILLFTTGHWVRLVPLTWEVLPNALSAGIQYLSLDWPTENGWVNYNSLQQIAYFTTVFVAAPLAALTGARMSVFWPKGERPINRAFPLELARALHFPTMLYFVVFILMHVALVMATGALRNLNHMYTATDTDNWWGAIIFAASLLVMAGAWFAARPTILASIAAATGKVGR